MNSIQLDRENSARYEGRIEGRIEGKMEVAGRMLAMGMSESQVREITGLTDEQLEDAKQRLRPGPGASPNLPHFA